MDRNKNGSSRADEFSCSILTRPSEALEQFRRGEITEDQYLEARIAQATRHLSGRVSGSKLKRIRTTLQRICADDPVLLAMKERVLRA